MLKRSLSYCLVFTLVASLNIFTALAGEPSPTDSLASEHQTTEKFDPGSFIIDHIVDAHDWHILTTPSGHHVSIPLPVIIYSKTSGWHIFWSSAFHHGHREYNGFMLSTEGEYKGKILERNGNEGFKPVYLDLSITKVVAGVLVSVIILLWIFLSVANRYRRLKTEAPKGVQSLLEPIIIFIRDEVAKPAIGEHKYEKFLPFLLTVFFFILLNNLVGLIPFFPFGVNVTGNIAVTMVLALFTFVITTINGNKHYWKEIYNAPGVPWWLKFPIPLMPLVELLGVFTKPFVLMIRLFANISAGHIVALGFLSLIFIFGAMSVWIGYGVSVISVFFTMFMILLDVLVSFIQAYVFTLLSALYFGMATVEHHHEK